MSYCIDQRGKAKEMTDLTAELAFTVIRKNMQAETKFSFSSIRLSFMQIVWSSNLLNHAYCDNTTGRPSELCFVAF